MGLRRPIWTSGGGARTPIRIARMDGPRHPILITGITGFIGRHLAERLLDQGALVRGLSRSPERAAEPVAARAEIVRGDLLDPPSLRSAVEGCRVVYHCAAEVGERAARQRLMDVNVQGTEHLVSAALEAGVRRFVHISSCAVYGSPQLLGIDESFPLQTGASDYHDSKVRAEAVVWKAIAGRDLPAVIARPSQVYGPRSVNFTVRPVKAIRSGRMILIDRGRHFCKPIYIDDLIDGLLACAEAERAIGEAFNLTNDEPVPWRVFFGGYAAMMGKRRLPSIPYSLAWPLAVATEIWAKLRGSQPHLNRRTVASLRSTNSFSNRKARRMLGWEPKVSLEEGMRRTRAWLREEGYLPQA